MIWAAYFAIPFLLFRLITKRADIPFPKIFWLFIAFIFLCGATHLMDALIFWWPAYRFSAILRFVTGTVSLTTVYALYRILPLVMNLRTAAGVEAEAEQRRKAEIQFSNAFIYSAVGMALVSPEGKWMKVNPTLMDFLGYTEEELRELTFQDVTYKEDLGLDLQYVKQMLDGNIRSYQMEKRYVKKNGVITWGLLTCSLVKDEAGVPEFFIAQVADIELKAERLSGQIKISVTDYGIGIASEKIAHLFERFFRVENTSQNFSGLGMGLYISSEIIEMHGELSVPTARLERGLPFILVSLSGQTRFKMLKHRNL